MAANSTGAALANATSANLTSNLLNANPDKQQSDSVFSDPISQTKLLASLILFAITLLCGYLPVRILLNQSYVQYAMFAGGGVLMATAFCHLIPEAHDNYKLASEQLLRADLSLSLSLNLNLNLSSSANASASQTKQVPSTSTSSSTFNLPYLELTLCSGFFFMYLVEQLMVRFINNHTHEHPCDTSLGQLVGGDSRAPNSNGLSAANQQEAGQTTRSGALSARTLNQGSASDAGSEFYKFIRGLLIVSAFGAHSIFDGVAIGSQETIEKVWTIFLAISCHKLIIAAVVGLELYTATLESHLWTLVHLSIFSIMSPIGIILVVLAQNSLHLNSNHPAMILLQSFATGTLLYIVFVEILQPKEEQAYEKNRFGKSVALIGGFALMLLVLTLMDE